MGFNRSGKYADDSAVSGNYEIDGIIIKDELGPLYGYYPSSSKTHLLLNPESLATAMAGLPSLTQIFVSLLMAVNTSGEQ